VQLPQTSQKKRTVKEAAIVYATSASIVDNYAHRCISPNMCATDCFCRATFANKKTVVNCPVFGPRHAYRKNTKTTSRIAAVELLKRNQERVVPRFEMLSR